VQSALVLILLGELTSPLQNLWYFARYLKDRSQVGLLMSSACLAFWHLSIVSQLRSGA
jgi:hypothetical protein